MPIYTVDDYFGILTDLIREDRVVPFACYILLPANKRTVKIVAAGEPFDARIIEKLRKFNFDQVYVRNEDRAQYEVFLREFFATPEGKVLVKTLQDKSKDGAVSGISDELAAEFGMVTVEATKAEPESSVTVKGSKEAVDKSQTSIKGGTDHIKDESVNVKGFKDLSDEQKTTIKGSTDKIQEELLRVKGLPNPGTDQSKKLIKESAKVIKDELFKISEVADSNDENRELFKIQSGKIEAQVEVITRFAADKEAPRPQDVTIFKNTVTEISKDIQTIKSLNQPAAGESSVVFKTMIPPEMKAAVESENKLAIKLIQKLTIGKKQFGTLKGRWEEFQKSLISKFSDLDKLAAREFLIQLQDLDSQQAGIEVDGNSLKVVSEELCTIAEVAPQALVIEAEVAAPSGPKEGSLELPPEADPTADLENLKSENTMLRDQLSNAKALLDGSNEKLANLRNYVDNNSVYIETLEKEVKILREQVAAAQTRILNLENNNISSEESAAAAQRITLRTKKESEKKDETIHSLQEKLQAVEKELNFFKDKYKNFDPNLIDKVKDRSQLPVSDEFVSVLLQKDKLLENVSTKVESRERENQELDKTNQRLKHIAEDANLLKKRMGQKFEQMESEKEMKRLELEQVGRKFISSNNLLETARKTISRLNTHTEELKKERVEFMNKTNASVKEYKEILAKANALNSHVQTEIKRNEKSQGSLDSLKSQNRELSTEVNELKKQVRTLEAEMRKSKMKNAS
jgi:hypothetical protein